MPDRNAATPERLWTLDEVSAYLGIPKRTLYNWRGQRRGPKAIRLGQALRYRPSDVEAYLAAHTDGGEQ